MMKIAIKLGQAHVLGTGSESVDHVHVLDLADMYELLLRKLVSSDVDKLPYGERGIYFGENGSCTWREVADGVVRAGVKLGVLKTEEVREVHSCQEWADLVGSTSQILLPSASIVELGFAGHFKTSADLARELLGWKPTRGSEAFERHFEEEMRMILEQEKYGA